MSTHMNLLYIFLLFLVPFGETLFYNRLSPEENAYMKSICGTKPYRPENYAPRMIYGGRPIPGSNAPWAVQFRAHTSMLNTRLCSGTIISPRHILAASHCVIEDTADYNTLITRATKSCDNNNRDMVFVQETNMYQILNANNELLSNQVSKLILMNYCNGMKLENADFLIIELKNNIPFNDFAYPACVSNNYSYQAVGQYAILTAYGHNSWSFDNEDLRGTFALRDGNMIIYKNTEDWRLSYMKDDAKKVVLRTGDSGGSAISIINSRYTLIGVIQGSAHDQFVSDFESVVFYNQQICYYTGVC